MRESMPTIEGIQPLLDVDQAASFLGVSPYTIRAWIREGKLNATKLGRLVRVEPAEIQKLISAGRHSSTDNKKEMQ
jgi:excisionase family DNA binding protein